MTWEPQLKREARRVLKTRYGDGQIDQMLQSENVTYADIVGLLDNEVIVKALLSVIVAEARGDNAAILACWLADPSYDATIIEKSADAELHQLVASRLGSEIAPEMPLDETRRRVARYVLLGEFRSNLQAEPPATVQMVPRPSTKDQLEMVRRVANELRRRHPATYVTIADARGAGIQPARAVHPGRGAGRDRHIPLRGVAAAHARRELDLLRAIRQGAGCSPAAAAELLGAARFPPPGTMAGLRADGRTRPGGGCRWQRASGDRDGRGPLGRRLHRAGGLAPRGPVCTGGWNRRRRP